MGWLAWRGEVRQPRGDQEVKSSQAYATHWVLVDHASARPKSGTSRPVRAKCFRLWDGAVGASRGTTRQAVRRCVCRTRRCAPATQYAVSVWLCAIYECPSPRHFAIVVSHDRQNRANCAWRRPEQTFRTLRDNAIDNRSNKSDQMALQRFWWYSVRPTDS
jgi:hypothetical protein